jgi:thioredoxin
MKKQFIVLFAVGVIGCSFTACNNAQAVNESGNTANTEMVEESEPTLSEGISESNESNATEASAQSGIVRKINTETFIAEIFDYKANPQTWVYKGNKPAIIDFYADWCGPCKRVAPIMDELAKEYAGQVNFYKVNTDDEKELSGGVFGIRSIPSILYIPVNGQPSMSAGAASKEEYIKQIEMNLLKK